MSLMQLAGKKILLGITGSIAAYKSILLLRLLVRAGADVKVVQTTAARDFVSPLVLGTLSRNPVLTDLADGSDWANHVMLGRWADLMVIAPLSCNTLAKMATGMCDNLLMAVYLSATCPVLVCPAMDEDMWRHARTQHNLSALKNDGVAVMPVGHGELGSGLTGAGRMAEPEAIFDRVVQTLCPAAALPLQGKNAMVTAGPTYEPIDPVRFIGNHASGKMGIAIADALARQGAQVTLILGPSAHAPREPKVQVVAVQTADDMLAAANKVFPQSHIAVFAAAVADYKPAMAATQKIKKEQQFQAPVVQLVQNPDILMTCGAAKTNGQLIVGFALETEHELANATRKMQRKHADIMVLNSLRDAGAGFGTDTNKITILDKNGTYTELPLMHKDEAARAIVQVIQDKLI